MNSPYIINLQKYSIHDGEGIRTTVFFKGCLLNCWWCHNPESQSYNKEIMCSKERCIGCGRCYEACDMEAITFVEGKPYTNTRKCSLCSKCIDTCISNNREIVGKEYTVEELIKELDKDKQFYEDSQGGITLSGGEVMTQPMEYIEKLARRIKARGYNLAVDTCGYAPTENYKRILPYVDMFLFDIKVMDDEKHIKYMGKSNKLILENLKFISDNEGKINIRIPIIEPVNSDNKAIEDIIIYLKENIRVEKFNLLPYHNTGSSKYEKLQKENFNEGFKAPSVERMEEIAEKFKSNGFINVKIGG